MLSQRNKTMAVISLSLLMTTSAFGKITTNEANKNLFGAPYQEVAAPAPDRAKIVYYWTGPTVNNNSGANVYIDARFHTALQVGGYTVFCLLPGSHTLGAYQNDSPLYKGKNEEIYKVKLEAGKTYFIKVMANGSSAPIPVLRSVAERELKGTHLQKHTVSRAPILSCNSTPAK